MDNNEQFIANITEKPPQIFGLEYVNVCVSLYISISHHSSDTDKIKYKHCIFYSTLLTCSVNHAWINGQQ